VNDELVDVGAGDDDRAFGFNLELELGNFEGDGFGAGVGGVAGEKDGDRDGGYGEREGKQKWAHWFTDRASILGLMIWQGSPRRKGGVWGTRGTGRKAKMFPQRLKPVYARFFVGPKGPTPGAKIG
jgi:hypothetical protein